jgi:hypothetical protein
MIRTRHGFMRSAMLALLFAGSLVGGGVGDAFGASTSAVTTSLDSNAILGFETEVAWTTSGGTPSSTTTRTQGAAAYAVANPTNLSVLISSAPVESTATALTGLGTAGSTFAVDVMLPAQRANVYNAGSLQLFVNSQSRNVQNANLGIVSFRSAPGGIYRTVKFTIPNQVRQALAGGAFSDLTFHFSLHVPGRIAGPYRFDNLRVHSPSTPPPGPGQSVDLTALLSYSPPASTPGVASFPVGIIQVPESFHVKHGSAGTSGTTQLDLGNGGTSVLSCTYAAASGGTSYALTSCTGGFQAGDLVAADDARLAILSSDPTAGTTKIRAQLAENPVGDIAGPGIIPPMPTFWGEGEGRAAQSKIVEDYFDLVNAASLRSEERFIRTPVPFFARHVGDGSPRDNLGLQPPPPLDPPFDKEGHMNDDPDPTWDAFWRLRGSLSSAFANNHTTTDFDMNLSAHAVVFGDDIEVASLQATVHTDGGDITNNFIGHGASGSLHMFLFGAEIPGGGDADPNVGFEFGLHFSDGFEIPVFDYWVFSITLGVGAHAGVTATGVLSAAGFDLGFTPEVGVEASINGEVNVALASGDISVVVDLFSFSTPLTAAASWNVSTAPEVCASTLNFLADGNLTLKALGGRAELRATYGICPICDHESETIFDWDPVFQYTKPIFHFETSNELFSLPSSLCILPLAVTMNTPAENAQIRQFFPLQLNGIATRPPSPGIPDTNLDCSILTWTTSDRSDTGFPAAGCTPTVTFNNAGPRTVTLSASDQFGEVGATSHSFTVTAVQGPVPIITTPSPFSVFDTNSGPVNVSLRGSYTNGTLVDLSWVVTSSDGSTVFTGTGSSQTWTMPGCSNDTFTITLTATDRFDSSLANSASIQVKGNCTH